MTLCFQCENQIILSMQTSVHGICINILFIKRAFEDIPTIKEYHDISIALVTRIHF